MKKILALLCSLMLTATIYGSQYAVYEIDLGGAQSSFPITINNSGQVLGVLEHQGKLDHFFWSPESGLSIIGGFPSPNEGVRAEMMNNKGQVVGGHWVNEGWILPSWTFHGFLWSLETGFVDLGTIEGDHTRAVSINDEGEILLISSYSAAIWKNGEMSPIEDVFGIKTCERIPFYPTAVINSKGQLAYSRKVPYKSYFDLASIYNIETRQSFFPVDGFEGASYVGGINDSGAVFGSIVYETTIDGFIALHSGNLQIIKDAILLNFNADNSAVGCRWIDNSLQGAIIVEEGKVSDLTSLCFQTDMSVEPHSRISVATDINDRGEVIAQMVDDSGREVVVILVPLLETESTKNQFKIF